MRRRDPFDRLGDELRRAAERASPTLEARTRPAGRRWWRPVAVSAALALALTVVLTTTLDGGRVDPLEAATAAVTPSPGSVVHVVLEGGPVGPDGAPAREGLSTDGRRVEGYLARRLEQWSTVEPLRFRSSQAVVRPSGERLGTFDLGLTGTGLAWTDRSWDGQPARTEDVDRVAPSGDIAEVGAFRAPDPIGGLRQRLSEGTLRAERESTEGGRRVFRIVETAPGAGASVAYLLDAETHEPLEIERTTNGRTLDRYRVTTFDRVPLNDRTRQLFAPPSTNDRP
jgi:hypothetical protein